MSDGVNCTLREAIINANNDDTSGSTDCAAGDGVADTITFNFSGTILLGSQLPAISDSDALTIDGAGQSIVISGNNATRILAVNSAVTLNLNELTIAHGRQPIAGAIHNAGSLTVTNSTFDGNTATSDEGNSGGGAILNEGTLTVTNSTFSGNNATRGSHGGAVLNQRGGSTLTVTNSTFSGNSAFGGFGGAIFNNGGTLTVTNSTLSGNRARSVDGGGGISIFGLPANMQLRNTIIANSTSGGDCVDPFNTFGTNVNNLIEDGSCSPAFSGDPLLVALAPNGGPTETMALDPNSPAIDKGDPATCAAAPVSNLDQRGFVRPVDGDAIPGAVCDIGAFEFGATGEVPILLIIDADTINNGIKAIQTISYKDPFCGDGSPSVCVNDDIADPGVREILFTRGEDITPFSGLVLPTGKKGDEGLFRFINPDPQISEQNGATFTIQEFIFAQGEAADENNLDKISGVVALTAAEILELEGRTVCAVVYDSDISVDRSAGYASLKGSTLGLTAFTVTAVPPVSKGLPKITVDLLDSEEVESTCEGVLPPEL